MACGQGSYSYVYAFTPDGPPGARVRKCLKCRCENEQAGREDLRCTNGMIARHIATLPLAPGESYDYRKCDGAGNPIDGTDVRFQSATPKPPKPPMAEKCGQLKGQAKKDCIAARVKAAGAGTFNPPTSTEQGIINAIGTVGDVVSGLVGAQRTTDLKVTQLAAAPKSTGFSLTNPDGGPNIMVLALLGIAGYFAWKWLK